MSTLEEWTAAVCADLGLESGSADTTTVLDLARDVAHGVARPAAPLTAYLVGVAVGRGLPLPATAGRVRALAARWSQQRSEQAGLPGSYGYPGRRAQAPAVSYTGLGGNPVRRAKGWSVSTKPRDAPRPTRRGILLGAGLAGLGGALAGCSTAAVPYDADEAGVVPQGDAAPSTMTMPATGTSPGGARSASTPARDPGGTAITGTVLGTAAQIPVGGGTIFTAARVVVTQPTRGRYRAFSAVCTHVGCILNQVTGGTINCPCHGSKFTITGGAVVTGPAPSPLPKKQIKIVDGEIVLL